MKWLLLLAIATIVIGSASAGTLTVINYDPATSTGYNNLQGLYLNGSFVSSSFGFTDIFANATIDRPPWYTNGSGTANFQEVNSGGIRLMNLSTGTGAGDSGNFTYFVNLKQPFDTNTTFFLIATPTLAELRIVDGFQGSYTQAIILKPLGNDVPAQVPVSVYYNSSNFSITYYQSGAFVNTISVASLNAAYLFFEARGSGAVSSKIQINHYINTTNVTAIPGVNEFSYTYAPSYMQFNNATISGTGNTSSALLFPQFPNGSTNFSFNIKNFWINFTTAAGTTEGNYYFFNKNTSIINNASLYITVVDEETNTVFPKFTITIMNSTNTTSYGTQQGFFWSNWTGIPNGALTITIDNTTSYFPRNYIAYFNNPGLLYPSYINQTLYLLKSSGTSTTILFNIVSSTGATIPGALVTIQKQIAGTYVTVAQATTDASGAVGIFLSQINQYQIIVSASGYTSYVALLTPTSTSYTITLGTNGGNVTPGFFNNLSYSIQPTSPFIFNSTSPANINLTVNSSDSTLSAFSMNLTLGNGTVVYSQVSNSANGGVLAYAFNTTNMTGNITAVFRISKSAFSTDLTIVQIYIFSGSKNLGLQYSINLINKYTTPWFRFLVAVILSLVTTIFISVYIGFGSGLATMAVLGWFASIGWVWMPFYIVVCLALIALIITGRLNL